MSNSDWNPDAVTPHATPGSLRWQMQADILACVNDVLGEDFAHHEWTIADYLVSQGWEKKKKKP